MPGKVVVFTDGASRGNPGKAGIGVLITSVDGLILKEISEYIGITTNNVAEYRAVITGIEEGLELGADAIELKTDSQLVVRQLKGQYKVKNEGLKHLYRRAVELLSQYKQYSVQHIPREENTRADELANKSIDSST